MDIFITPSPLALVMQVVYLGVIGVLCYLVYLLIRALRIYIRKNS
ncbi:MAG: hypothetical protein ACRCS6_12455 [Turicibacter sp.]